MTASARSGEQHALSASSYAATVTEVGATLRELTYDGRALVAGFGPGEMMPLYRGAVLAPWPNRIEDGVYEFGGRSHQLALSEPDRQCALHGLVAWRPWQLVDSAAERVALRLLLHPQAGYPFLLQFDIAYELGDAGLMCTLTASNVDDRPLPYGSSIHTYLRGGSGRVDDWTLTLPAGDILDVDPDRLLPRDVVGADTLGFDYRSARSLSGVELDHAFTGVGWDAEGAAEAVVVDGDGVGAAIWWDRACPWVQVHTGDRPEPEYNRSGLALEPMTCPPNAFRSGTDLVVLEPGQEHVARWQVRAVQP